MVLVGHSYGGAIITEAGNDPKVAALVYVAAFAPDAGEVLGALLEKTLPASTGIAPSKDGFLFLDPAVYAADFAGDLPKAQGDFLALSQMPVASKAFGTPISAPAWKAKPTYGIVATEDRMINPDLERMMYKRAKALVTEVKGSHVVFLVSTSRRGGCDRGCCTNRQHSNCSGYSNQRASSSQLRRSVTTNHSRAAISVGFSSRISWRH